MGRSDLMERILKSFHKSASHEIETLMIAIETSNLAAVQNGSHKLKGTALTASANKLAQLANELYSTANSEMTVEFPDLSAQLSQEFESIEKLLTMREMGAV